MGLLLDCNVRDMELAKEYRHVYQIVTNDQARERFRSAIRHIPTATKWLHHGRDPAVGLDCWGLVFAAYRFADLSIDSIDLPYGERDANRESRKSLMLKQMGKRFCCIGPACSVFRPNEVFPAVEHHWNCWSGDVLTIGAAEENHVALVVETVAVEITRTRMRVTRLENIWPFVTGVYRHRQVLGI